MLPASGDNILESIRQTGESVALELLSRHLPAGQAQQIAEDIGIQTAAEVGEIWGGSPVYVPKNTASRRARIYDSYTGDNVRELARQFHFTERNIRLIIAAERQRRQGERKNPTRQQATLPGL